MHIYIHKYPQKPEEGVGVPGAGVTGGCELPDMDARKL